MAHIYLGGENPGHVIGNFIADHFQGNQFEHFAPDIIEGIRIHREIDTFTDTDDLLKESKIKIRKDLGLFSGIAIDIYMDYYLAKHWDKFHSADLETFTKNFYALCKQYTNVFPEKSNFILVHMEAGNWLLNYRQKSGIEMALNGLHQRVKLKNKLHLAPNLLWENEAYYEEVFFDFFPRLKNHIEKIKKINSKIRLLT